MSAYQQSVPYCRFPRAVLAAVEFQFGGETRPAVRCLLSRVKIREKSKKKSKESTKTYKMSGEKLEPTDDAEAGGRGDCAECALATLHPKLSEEPSKMTECGGGDAVRGVHGAGADGTDAAARPPGNGEYVESTEGVDSFNSAAPPFVSASKNDDSDGDWASAQVQDEQELMRKLGLPTCFGKSNVKPFRKKHDWEEQPVIEEPTDYWMLRTTFKKYWRNAGRYLTYMVFLNDYGHLFVKEGKAALLIAALASKPRQLISEHESLESLQSYFGILYKVDPNFVCSTAEELLLRQEEVLKQQAMLDYNDYIRKRVLTAFTEITEHGFALKPSFHDIGAGTAESLQSAFAQGNGVIVDVIMAYNFEAPPPLCEKLNPEAEVVDSEALKPKMEKNGRAEEIRAAEEGIPSTLNEQDFDFSFDEVRDSWLIGTNATTVYVDDEEIRKYFKQRYRLFSRFNEGTLLDREGWFSVTPERLAEHIADRVVLEEGALVVDAFCGIGGNSIQMALRGAHVIAVDLDPVRIRCAAHNARIYGVEDYINFVCMDFFHFAQKACIGVSEECLPRGKRARRKRATDDNRVDAVFLSPPWGGPSYHRLEVFDLNAHMTPQGVLIFEAARKLSKNVAMFVPRQTDVAQLAALAVDEHVCEVEQNLMHGRVKSLTAYYGDLCDQYS